MKPSAAAAFEGLIRCSKHEVYAAVVKPASTTWINFDP
jgi:hypothetical protein